MDGSQLKVGALEAALRNDSRAAAAADASAAELLQLLGMKAPTRSGQ